MIWARIFVGRMSTEAYRKRKRDWAKTESQKEKRKLYMRVWRKNNKEHYNSWSRLYHKLNKHLWASRTRVWRLKCTYGITEEDYNGMLLSQNNKCLICGKEHKDTTKGLHIDHSHETLEIRGLLCSRCNGALGWYEKYSNEIKSYLKK
jgi:hypothetical protein